MKQKLLIIDKHQFGYLTDAYKWCQYLCDEYNIEFITANVGNKIMCLPGVKVHYVSFKLPRLLRAFLFVIRSLIGIYWCNGKILIEYFQGCSILKRLCPWKKMIVDVRTLSVSPDSKHRIAYNSRLIKDCSYFDEVLAISQGVAKQMGVKNVRILPLGSDVISTHPKIYTGKIELLYVGTLRWRNIERTIEGFKIFVHKHPELDILYRIIGDGLPGQLEALKQLAEKLGVAERIIFHGFLPLTELKPYFDRANVGVSFVPMTEYYDYQPPTKTFEYILSGLYCIATATSSNKELINAENGCLIQDTVQGFADGIEKFVNCRHEIDESRLRNTLSHLTWANIVKTQLANILNNI